MECGGDEQDRRPTDAGREGGRRAVVRAAAAALSHAAGEFSFSDGAQPGAGGRSGAGSFYSGISRAGRVCAEREVHHLAVSDRDESGAELTARSPAPEAGNGHASAAVDEGDERGT